MGKLSLSLKLLQTILYALAFCCAAIILGFYSYFLAVQADRNDPIDNWQKAVTGISGAGVLYTIAAVVLTCCLGGVTIFAFLAIALNVLFTGGFIAIAVLTRDGARSCTGFVRTPLGNGPANNRAGFDSNGPSDNDGFGFGDNQNTTYAVSFGRACTFNKVAFAVSIIGAGIFLISAVVQLFLGRQHKKDKRYGPSPANGYTAGPAKRRFWQRKSGPKTTYQARDAELGTNNRLSTGAPDMRPSHETGYTGSTVGNSAAYDNTGKPVHGVGGYHTAPATNY